MPASVPVLCYHNVQEDDGHSPARFAEHLDAIVARGYRTITALELFEWMTGKRRLSGRCCVLTFDDGHVSNWMTVAPMLRERGMTGVFFALADFIDDAPARDPETLPPPAPLNESLRRALRDGDHSQFMNRGELTALIRDFGCEVHTHGCRHQGCYRGLRPRKAPVFTEHWGQWGITPGREPGALRFAIRSAYAHNGFWPLEGGEGEPEPWFRRRTEAERRAFCREDFRRSLEVMQAINGGGPQFFCWPWGVYDAAALEELRASGFAGAFSLDRGPNAPGGDPYRIYRIGVAKNKDGAWLKRRLAMFAHPVAARVCGKRTRPRPEPGTVLFATDSRKLSGGSRQMVYNAEILSRMGIHVLAAVPGNSPLAGPLAAAGAEVAPFDEFRSPVATARFLRRLVRERGVDVIHTFHNKAYKGAILARVLTGGGFRLFLNRGVIFKPNALVGLWARLASGMVANSFCCSEVLQCHLAPKGRISVVYNALDMSGIPARDPGARARRGLRFAWVGNAAPVKGPDVFFRAVEAYCGGGDVRDVEFTVCGVDDASPFLPLAGGAAGRIHNTGTLPHPRILEQMAAADVFVSSSRLESMPNTLLEAFALSLPVVATDVGGVSELVAHEVNGLLVPEGDHEALARAMRELADDFETRVRMGRVNRRLAERLFCPQRKGRNLVRTYMGETVRERPDIRALLEEVADE